MVFVYAPDLLDLLVVGTAVNGPGVALVIQTCFTDQSCTVANAMIMLDMMLKDLMLVHAANLLDLLLARAAVNSLGNALVI